MSFAPSEAQLEFVSSVRGFLERSAPLHSVRELMDTVDGFDARLWRGLSTELGLAGLAVPAQHGGSAAGFATQA